jgi:exonuclease SbcC
MAEPETNTGPADLAVWAAGLLQVAERAVAERMAESVALDSRGEEAAGAAARRFAEHGAADAAELRGLADSAAATVAVGRHRVAGLHDAVREAEILDNFLAVGEPFLANLEVLSQTLTDGRFIRALVAERERELLVEASRKLRELTGETFGFGEAFRIVDRRTGQRRLPETLSGGERFLASLALALGLVEIATRGGGQLDALFLDEGFGSLDSSSLDQALSTLGGLAVGGKLVVLVSHLRRVAEHVDDVLLVTRDDVTGSAVRRLGPDERDQLLADDARAGLTL